MPYSQNREFQFSAPWVATVCVLVGSGLNIISRIIASQLDETDLMPNIAAQSVHSVMFLSFFLIVPFISISNLGRQKVVVRSSVATASAFLAAVLGLAAYNIRLQENDVRVLVACEVAVFAICSILTMLRVLLLNSESKVWLAAMLLLGPSISHLVCTAFSVQRLQSYMFVVILIQIAMLVSLTIPIRKRLQGLELQKIGLLSFQKSTINVVFYFVLLAGVVIPIGLSKIEQTKLVDALSQARLPLYCAMLFSIFLLPQFLTTSTNKLLQIAQRRNFVFLSGCISLCSGLVVILSRLFEHANTLSSGLLNGLSIFTSLVLALLMPWLILKIQDNEFDIPAGIASSVIVIAYGAGLLRSAVAWPLVGSLSFLVLASLAIARHILESRAVMGSRQRNVIQDQISEDNCLVSVVIPSYNPGSAIVTTLQTLNSVMRESSFIFEVIVVTDGSTDESPQLLEDLTPQISHVWMKSNRGKGSALREGFSRTKGDVVCFIDADGDLDPQSLPQMAKTLIDHNLDVVYGSKLHPNSIVEMSSLRRVVSFGFRLIVRILFHIDISDTQTGIKAFNGDLIRRITPYCRESGFNLDLELFVLAKEFGHERYLSYPINLRRTGGTTVGLSTLANMLLSIAQLFVRVNLSLNYTTDRAKYEGAM